MNPEHEQSRSDGRSGFGLAGRFLLPFSPLADQDSPGWRRVGVWLPVWGLIIGVVYAGAFRGLWFWLGEYQHIRLAPMALLLVIDAGWLGYRLLAGAAGVVTTWPERADSPVSPPTVPTILFLVLAVLVKFAFLVALPAGAVTWPADWRENLRIVYPYVIYRPLILMPLWGRWGVLLAANIGRAAPTSSTRLESLAEGTRLPTVMAWCAAISAITVMYCSPSGYNLAHTSTHVGYAMLISLIMMVVAYLASFVLARRFNGQTEATVTAAGWAVEMAFLLAYLPLARYIYWY